MTLKGKYCNSTDTSNNDEKNSVIFGNGPKRGAKAPHMKRLRMASILVRGACALVNLLGPLLSNRGPNIRSGNKKDTRPNSLSLAHLRRVDLSVGL